MIRQVKRACRLACAGIGLSAAATAMARGQANRLASDTLLPAQLHPVTRQAIERLADSMRAAGLPSDPIFAKAAEGVLKGADDERILTATRTLARELSSARVALGEGAAADESELVAGASALHVGVTPAVLRRLSELRALRGGRESLAAPLVALADLVSRHVPVAVASASLDSLVARGAPSSGIAALRAAVDRDIRAGHPPDASTISRTRSLLDQLSGAHDQP